jgi:DNA-binding NtrC family response regulator
MQDALRSILLVIGNKTDREKLAVLLRDRNDCLVLEAGNPEQALQIVSNEDVNVMLTDLFLPHKAGIDLLKQLNQANPQLVSLAGLPENNRDARIEALKAGAFFCIHTPYDPEEVVIATSRAFRHIDFLMEGEQRGRRTRKTEGFQGIIGNSPKMQKLFQCIDQVAAEGNHSLGPRHGKNFVPVNCAAIPEDLLESELFGYVKGAFTGANQSKMGRIQYSEGGTLFLDEIGDMKPSLQSKLLRVIQEREFEPVGGIKPISIDVRIVAATHRNLEKTVAEGNFREDLYYRLNVVPITVPPLRERREDVSLLIDRFVAITNRNKKKALKGFSPEAVASLMNHDWPGNVRELENLVQRMAIFCGGSIVTLEDLPDNYRLGAKTTAPEQDFSLDGPEIHFDGKGIDFNSMVNQFESQLINHALMLTGGNKREAAKLLNLKRTTLIEKIKRKRTEDEGFAELDD